MMEGLVTTPASPSTNGLATGAFPTIDPNVVVEYLTSVLEITLGAKRKDLECVGSLFSKARYSETVQRCTRFATESQVALYVQKDIATDDGLNGIVDSSGICFISCRTCPDLTDPQKRLPTHTAWLQIYPSPHRRRPRLHF